MRLISSRLLSYHPGDADAVSGHAVLLEWALPASPAPPRSDGHHAPALPTGADEAVAAVRQGALPAAGAPLQVQAEDTWQRCTERESRERMEREIERGTFLTTYLYHKIAAKASPLKNLNTLFYLAVLNNIMCPRTWQIDGLFGAKNLNSESGLSACTRKDFVLTKSI